MSRTVLVCGASGFIGQQLAHALTARGHRVLHGVRDPAAFERAHPGARTVPVDFSQPREPAHWLSLLRGVDVVINAVGLLRETAQQRFADVQTRSPCALFEACSQIGVRRVIQLSALGADADADTAFLQSKHVADDCLLALPLEGVVLQPSLVFGPGGASTTLFCTLASLPVVPLPAGGMQPIQPVHLDDLVGAVVALVESAQPVRGRLQVVGPEATTLKAYLQAIRKGLGLGAGTWLPVPRAIMARLAQAGSRHRGALFDEDSWRMLQRGNTGPATSLSALLGRPPRSAETFVSALPHSEREALRHHAVMAWSKPLWRASLALLWFASGLVSLGLYPVADSFAMLAQVGIPATLRPVALYGAAGLDIALGVLTLWRSGRRVWLAQIGLILAYTAIITLFLPAQWLHPFAPIVKNGPILAMLLTLYATETRR